MVCAISFNDRHFTFVIIIVALIKLIAINNTFPHIFSLHIFFSLRFLSLQKDHILLDPVGNDIGNCVSKGKSQVSYCTGTLNTRKKEENLCSLDTKKKEVLIYIFNFQLFDCRNHIRVIQSMDNGNRLYICGTNAHSPKDYVIYVSVLCYDSLFLFLFSSLNEHFFLRLPESPKGGRREKDKDLKGKNSSIKGIKLWGKF